MPAAHRSRVARSSKRGGPARGRLLARSAPIRQANNVTRERILLTAERLFAEQGISVSNRQIGEAAGQANNSVVAYHFGSKRDLVLAIIRSHAPDIETRRLAMLKELPRGAGLRDWLICVVKPVTDHLAALGSPSWYARFLAQTSTDPSLRQVVIDETVASPSMRATLERVSRLLPVLPQAIYEERGDMTRHIVVHTCAERERALHASLPTPRSTWDDAAMGMIDALLGLWRAPVRQPKRTSRT